MNRKTLLPAIALSAIIVAAGISGCAESTTPADTATVTFVGQTDGSTATKLAWGKSSGTIALDGMVVDSIEITRVRYLLSAVKLHVEGNDTTKDGTLKTGPFVAEFTPGLSRTYSTVDVPAGSYEKIKFEIHKFPSSIDQTFLNDPVFTDFVTGERSTVIIEGKVWPTNVATSTNFVYKSHITANLETKFPGSVSLGAGSTTTLAMIFNPMLAFKSTFVLDPRDPQNSGNIDTYLKTTIKALKK